MSVVSSDSHIIESPKHLVEFGASNWITAAPSIRHGESGDFFVVPGVPYTLPIAEVSGSNSAARWRDVPRSAYEPEARLNHNASVGVVAELLFPTVGLLVSQHLSDWYWNSFAESYNRWLCAHWTHRGFGKVLLMPRGLTLRQSEQLAETAVSHGASGILFSNRERGGWSSPSNRKVLGMVSESGLVAVFHAFVGSPQSEVSRDSLRFSGAARDAMDVLSEMLAGRVLHRNPKLRVVVAEGGAWWVDSYFNEAARRGLLPEDLPARLAVTMSAPEILQIQSPYAVWGSDYPHGWAHEADPIDLTGLPNRCRSGEVWLGSHR